MKTPSRAGRGSSAKTVLAVLAAVVLLGRARVAEAAEITVGQLLRMDQAALDDLYRRAAPGPVPSGKVRGTALVRPGSRLAGPLARGARVVWQGKVFRPDEGAMVNRFFGLRMIRANVAYGESWMDGGPTLVLDYRDTSRVYARYRDEVRQVAPGLYLGVMYQRAMPRPTVKLYFVLEDPTIRP